jgi:Uma2 family endonuclease
MTAHSIPKSRMKVPEFLAWVETQPHGRYELVGGEIVAMAPERVRHNLVKLAVARALQDAVKAAALPCIVFTDGVAIVINDETTREPDASVQCGVQADLDSMIIEAPLIVVEVTSPSSENNDVDVKLVDYFSVPSIQHYLIIFPERRVAVHHQRNDRGTIDTRIVHDGDIVLNPPGISLPVTALLGPASSGDSEPNQTAGSH